MRDNIKAVVVGLSLVIMGAIVDAAPALGLDGNGPPAFAAQQRTVATRQMMERGTIATRQMMERGTFATRQRMERGTFATHQRMERATLGAMRYGSRDWQ
jgi:hypothetical protein